MLSQKQEDKLKAKVKDRYFKTMPNDTMETFEKKFKLWLDVYIKNTGSFDEKDCLSSMAHYVNLETINYRLNADRIHGTQFKEMKEKEEQAKAKADILKIIKDS